MVKHIPRNYLRRALTRLCNPAPIGLALLTRMSIGLTDTSVSRGLATLPHGPIENRSAAGRSQI